MESDMPSEAVRRGTDPAFDVLTAEQAEKRSALLTLDYLRAEAVEGRRGNFEAFLDAVPDVEPTETDRVE